MPDRVLRLTTIDELAGIEADLHLALGVFDGVHVGHRAVLDRAFAATRDQGGLTGVVTFDPHPIRVLAPSRAPSSLLATLDHKAHLLGELGVDLLLAISFDEVFAALEAEVFVERLCQARVKTLAVGEDWQFGRGRRGDVALLRQSGEKFGFQLEAVPPVMEDGERISSTRIRQAIRDGNLAAAAKMLGRPYSVEGSVERGRQLGRQLGFPTANVATGDVQLPPDGVWAVRVGFDEKELEGVANLGMRPTVDGHARTLEVHLFDFEGELYGCELDVTFVARLREERKFESLEALKRQIELDTIEARARLGQA